MPKVTNIRDTHQLRAAPVRTARWLGPVHPSNRYGEEGDNTRDNEDIFSMTFLLARILLDEINFIRGATLVAMFSSQPSLANASLSSWLGNIASYDRGINFEYRFTRVEITKRIFILQELVRHGKHPEPRSFRIKQKASINREDENFEDFGLAKSGSRIVNIERKTDRGERA